MTCPAMKTPSSDADFDAQLTWLIKAILNLRANSSLVPSTKSEVRYFCSQSVLTPVIRIYVRGNHRQRTSCTQRIFITSLVLILFEVSHIHSVIGNWSSTILLYIASAQCSIDMHLSTVIKYILRMVYTVIGDSVSWVKEGRLDFHLFYDDDNSGHNWLDPRICHVT